MRLCIHTLRGLGVIKHYQYTILNTYPLITQLQGIMRKVYKPIMRGKGRGERAGAGQPTPTPEPDTLNILFWRKVNKQIPENPSVNLDITPILTKLNEIDAKIDTIIGKIDGSKGGRPKKAEPPPPDYEVVHDTPSYQIVRRLEGGQWIVRQIPKVIKP